MSVRVTEQDKVLARALRKLAFFADWPVLAIQRVREHAELWIYQEGEVIAEYGDAPRGLWGVASGCVSSYRISQNKKTFLLGPHWRGDVFGLTAALDGHPSPLAHAARATSLVFLIPRSVLRAVLHDSAEAAYAVSVFLCMRSRVEYEGTYATVVSSLRCRVAKYLAYLARGRLVMLETALDGNGTDPLPVDLTQSELASMIGISRQTSQSGAGSASARQRHRTGKRRDSSRELQEAARDHRRGRTRSARVARRNPVMGREAASAHGEPAHERRRRTQRIRLDELTRPSGAQGAWSGSPGPRQREMTKAARNQRVGFRHCASEIVRHHRFFRDDAKKRKRAGLDIPPV